MNARHYDALQVQTWASRADDAGLWEHKLRAPYFFVSEAGGALTGFAAMDDTGYVDLLFVHSAHLGKGIASALFAALESIAIEKKFTLLRADVSITARPFFKKKGFRVVLDQDVTIGEVAFRNYRMEKYLAGTLHAAANEE